MMGLEGRYIQACQLDKDKCVNINFKIIRKIKLPHGWNVSLVNLTERILPLCNEYVRVQAFVTSRLNGYEYGKVAHALCGAMDTLLQEYLDFVVNFWSDNNTFTPKLVEISQLHLIVFVGAQAMWY